ncbi:MAG: fibronectin type III domain-containing protein [Spirochaetaceae bacterium]|jgi:hypothetical protein|nr:fibronectin type III domain-containing protein [Spirochaetaceae bacterium]
MKNFNTLFGICCSLLMFTAVSVSNAEEKKTVTLGGASEWGMVKYRSNAAFLKNVRPNPVVSLSSSEKNQSSEADLLLTFDQDDTTRFNDSSGHYSVYVNPQVHTATEKWAHTGRGAALFSTELPVAYSARGDGPVTLIPRQTDALFSAGRNIADFSIDFWLYPNTTETGEEIINWNAVYKNNVQNLSLSIYKNRSHWEFNNFFKSPDNGTGLNVKLNASDPLVPKTWSHHLVRFNAETGLLEYIVNGITQDIKHVTSTGREDGEIFSPIAGERGSFVLGKSFNGMLDDFKVFSSFSETAHLNRYSVKGGRIETDVIDLGAPNCTVLSVDVAGGRVNFAPKGINEYQKNGSFQFTDGSQIQFFIRAASSPYTFGNEEWQVFNAGKPLNKVKGRYIQLAADLYPSGNCETTPYIEEINIVYTNLGSPKTPERLIAVAQDGSVKLSWKTNGTANGYLVYYGTSSGVYFCSDAIQGESPIDVGNTATITIDNLKNGTLYFFAVTAYTKEGTPEQGGFSREVSARPLRMAE